MDYRKDYGLYISFKTMGCDTRPCIECDNYLPPGECNHWMGEFVETCPARGRTDVTKPEHVDKYLKYYDGSRSSYC